VITLAALNGQTGDSLAREQVEADSKEQVLKSLDKAASGLRQKLGESLASVQQFATPLEQATTSSLEALQAFSLGETEHHNTNDPAAIPHLKRAVELDPNFATAYATLGVVYYNLSRPIEGAEALKKAYELRDRTSDREKLYIQAHYYDEVTLEIEKALAVYAEWRQIYPRETLAYDNAALSQTSIGQFDKAVELSSQSLRLDPQDRYGLANLAAAYEGLNRFDEAKSVADRAVSQKLDSLGIHLVLSDLARFRGDRDAIQHELQAAKGTPDEAFLMFWNAVWENSLGHVKTARGLWQQARQANADIGAKDFATNILAVEALEEGALGYQVDARQKASQSLQQAQEQDSDTRAIAAMALAVAGEGQKATETMAALERSFPENWYLRVIVAPQIQAGVQILKNQPDQAISALEPLRAYEFGIGPHGTSVGAVYLRGLAYMGKHDGAKAAAEFQRLLDHRGAAGFDVEYPVARLNLARAYVLQGDMAKAKTTYQDFFAAWKDADPDIPVLVQARAEYEKLK
jgi:tetratricopeptide (TPR) repeat protein